ncbi:MAG: hypothetical protein ACLQSR_14985 [Limisphaerales bacterium]
MDPIIESGMTFGPYPDEHCFHVEKSTTCGNIRQGVQMAEFLLLRLKAGRPPEVWVVEAKTSAPRAESTTDFADYIDEVREKLVNGFGVGLASNLRRHAMAVGEMPAGIRNLDLSTAGFRLLLVIKTSQDSWLPPLNDALQSALRSTVKTWALGSNAVAVLTEDRARQWGLIVTPLPGAHA